MSSSTLPGLFINIEGGDASGKSVQARALADYLTDLGHDVLLTHQPGGTPFGAQVRQILLHGDDIAPLAEAYLYAADKVQHVRDVIRPALEAGRTVITDRYVDSAIAYQGFGRMLGAPFVKALNAKATGNLWPDLTLVLDLPVEVAFARLEAAGTPLDRLESAGREFHHRLRNGLLRIAADDPWTHVIVDANAPVQTVTDRVRAAVDEHLAARVA